MAIFTIAASFVGVGTWNEAYSALCMVETTRSVSAVDANEAMRVKRGEIVLQRKDLEWKPWHNLAVSLLAP